MANGIGRREFLALVGGVAAWPHAVWAQQSKMARIGVLVLGSPDPGLFLTVFRQGLTELGYVEGNDIALELKSAAGDTNLLPDLAADLVRSKVDIIVAWQTPAATAAKNATGEIPIVISAGDPVGTGLVASLARPGGNITGTSGTTTDFVGKNIELIRELLPAARRVAILASATDPFTTPFLAEIETAARTLKMELRPIMVRSSDQLEPLFAQMKTEQIDAVVIQPTLLSKQVIDLIAHHRLPTVSPNRAFPDMGGLIAYDSKRSDLYRKTATYVDKILKGARPADLPVEQPTKFELVINLKTANALGLTVPPSLLARADEVIE